MKDVLIESVKILTIEDVDNKLPVKVSIQLSPGRAMDIEKEDALTVLRTLVVLEFGGRR